MTKSREARFIGSGNAWVAEGRYRGWKATCCGCGASKIVTSHSDRPLPPSIIVKRFTTAGWYIGRRAQDDMCGDCRRKPKQRANGKPASMTAAEVFAQIPLTPRPGQMPPEFFAVFRLMIDALDAADRALRRNDQKEAIDALRAIYSIIGHVAPRPNSEPNATATSELPITTAQKKSAEPATADAETADDDYDGDYDKWLARQHEQQQKEKQPCTPS